MLLTLTIPERMILNFGAQVRVVLNSVSSEDEYDWLDLVFDHSELFL